MNDLGILKAADDVRDGIGGANVAEKLIAQALALGRARDQAGNVDELHRGRHEGLGLDKRGDLVQPLVGHADDAHVGVDGAEGIVGCLRLGRSQRVENGGFADVGQTDDTAVQSHCAKKLPKLHWNTLKHAEVT